ncbi:hypothetical protein L7F22_016739 [Adiantum nelumboides]|nr:hypothetical protein [Adiantum nelumboides]
METDDAKVEEPSTSASTSSKSLKGVSKIGDMTIIDIDGLNQEHGWKVFEFIYNSAHYGVQYKELTQRQAITMITAEFQGILRYWRDDLNEESKVFILQGGIPKNVDNVITLFFAAMVMQFLGSQQKIKDRTVNTCLPSVYNSGYLCNNESQEKGQKIVMKVDPTSQGSLPEIVQWHEVEFSSKWKLNISKTPLNEAQQPMKMSDERLGLIDEYKLLGKSKSCKDLGPLRNNLSTKTLQVKVYPPADHQAVVNITKNGCYNGVTVLIKEQVVEKELKFNEPYILPLANARLQPLEYAINWHTNALKEIAKLQYSILSRINAMVKAKQSASTPSTSAAPSTTAVNYLVPLNYNTSGSSSILLHMFSALQSSFATSNVDFPQSLASPFLDKDLADAFNPSSRWGNQAKLLSAPHHRYTCGKMLCQLNNLEDYLWQGFMDDYYIPYEEQLADELDFNLANAFLELESISDSESEVIDEVQRLTLSKWR